MKKRKFKILIIFLMIVGFGATAFNLFGQKKTNEQALWYTWDPGVCSGVYNGSLVIWSRCVTPATDGPCIVEQSCFTGPYEPNLIY